MTDQEGLPRSIHAQVCDVNKPSLSVHKLVKAGNTVVSSPEGTYIRDSSGGDLRLVESAGMYHLTLWVPAGGMAGMGFQRPDKDTATQSLLDKTHAGHTRPGSDR